MSERVPTGIEGFDGLIEGGVPRGSLILLGGNPGSGKTIFSAQCLHHGASKLGEPGVYASFAENRESFLVNMKRMGMDFAELEEEGRFSFMDLVTVKKAGVEGVFDSILSEIDSLEAKRLVLDSFSALAQAFPDRIDIRVVLHNILGKMVRLRGVTTLLISEIPFGSESLGGGTEEFVADGVILLRQALERGYLGRRLQVVKMRGTKISTAQLRYDITERGIRVYPELDIRLVEKVHTEKVDTGIEGLDRMLSGGPFKGSVTLVAGASGTGKTTTALHFVHQGAKRNERGLYVSFEEPIKQLVRHGEGFGWNMKELVDDGVVKVASYYPEPFNFEEHILQVTSLLQDQRPVRFVIDSITALERVMSEDEYIKYIKSLESHLKADGVTSMFTATSASTTPVTGTGISTLMDNIVSLRDIELDSALRRSLVIFKARGTAHDRTITEFEITPKGMTVKEKFVGVEHLLGGAPRKSLTEEATRAWAQAFTHV